MRPPQDELEKKQRLCDGLTEDLASLRIETEELRALNDRCHEEMNRLENELLQKKNVENEKISAMAAMHQKKPTVPVLSDDAVGNTDVKCVSLIKEKLQLPSVINAETQTEFQEEEEEALVTGIGDYAVSISSNIEDFDYEEDDEEDDDEKTETIDTTEIFVGQRLLDNSGTSLNNSSSGTNDSVTSYSHNINSSSNTSLICNESIPRMDAIVVQAHGSEIGEPNGTLLEHAEPILLDTTSMQQELELINHPDVQREEELIAFKEKYTHLTQENIRLNQQLQKLNDDFSQFKSKSFMNLLMYIAPFIVIVGYIMFNRVS